jgi:hypothetical protein
MNNGTYGLDQNVRAFSAPVGGSWSGNKGRIKADEMRLWGYGDDASGSVSAARMINTSPQVKAQSIFFPGDLGSIINVLSGSVLNQGVAAPFSAMYNSAGIIQTNTNAGGNTSVFETNTIIQNYGGYSVSLPVLTSMVTGNLYLAAGGTVSIGVNPWADVISGIAFAATNGGTLSVGTVYNYQAKNTVIQAGVTVTKRVSYRVEDSSNSGTLTTQVGLEIPAMTGGITNVGISNASSLNQQGAVNAVNNAVTIVSNAATVPINQYLTTVTNSATPGTSPNITLTTTGATDGQMKIIRWYDSTAAAQPVTWTNTEDSTVAAAFTSNGSTTLPTTIGFMYNSQSSKWRCIARA